MHLSQAQLDGGAAGEIEGSLHLADPMVKVAVAHRWNRGTGHALLR